MSLEAVNAVLHHSEAVGTDKLILLGIAWHLGPDPEEGCWPRVARLAKYANVNERSVQRSLTRLIKLGELERFINSGVGLTDKRPNCYFVKLECPDTCTGYPQHKVIHRGDAGVVSG